MSARPLIAIAGAVTLAACSAQDEGEQPVAAKSQSANGTVAATVAASGDHRDLAMALTDTQLAPVLDGKGVYTLLAPSDAAFAKLGSKGEALGEKENRPLMIAILRAHVLPGQVTPEAIDKAIEREKGPVEMRTMAGGTVRFSKTERGIAVSNGSATASLMGASQIGSNGAVLPIDGVLLPSR